VAPPGEPPNAESFYVPGAYVWTDGRYMWRAGYWARVQPGYVWVAAHYRWTPGGYIYVAGYWDLAVSRRGFLYAPVVITPEVVTVGFVYTPCYCVSDAVVLDCLFVRPAYCHYYFGDYYAPAYRTCGFECCIVYSQRHYDSIIVYERYERRRDPVWFSAQITLCSDRCAGRAVFVQREYVTTAQLSAARGIRTVRLDQNARLEARAHAREMHEAALQRTHLEARGAGPLTGPRTAALRVPDTHPAAARAATPAAHPAAHSTAAPPGNHGAPPAPGHPAGPMNTGAAHGLTPAHTQPSARPMPGKPAPGPNRPPPPKDKDKSQQHQ
jgi:hypothetical protein